MSAIHRFRGFPLFYATINVAGNVELPCMLNIGMFAAKKLVFSGNLITSPRREPHDFMPLPSDFQPLLIWKSASLSFGLAIGNTRSQFFSAKNMPPFELLFSGLTAGGLISVGLPLAAV